MNKNFIRSIAVLLTFAVVLSTFVFSSAVVTNALTLDVSLGCYNSTESSKLGTGTDIANKYAATQIFSREDLPNGTEIRID